MIAWTITCSRRAYHNAIWEAGRMQVMASTYPFAFFKTSRIDNQGILKICVLVFFFIP